MQRPGGAECAAALGRHLLTDDFFNDHWETKPLHIKAAEGGREANLLPNAISTDDIVAAIRRSGSSLKIFKGGDPYDDGSFLHAYLDGATMIVNQADRYLPVLFDLCKALAQSHFYHVFGVIYLTPPNAQAVRLHNDDQDVFLMQIWGKKHWKVRNSPVLLPYTEEMLGKSEVVPPELVGEPIMEFDMEPHDMLFIPRGFLHEAATSDQPSLHITVTVPTSDYCWGVQAAKHLAQTLRLEQFPEHLNDLCDKPMSLLLGAGETDPDKRASSEAEVGNALEQLLQTWVGSLDADKALGAYEQRMVQTNKGQERSFSEAMALRLRPIVTENCRVRLMHGVSLVACEPERAVFIRLDDRQFDVRISPSAVSVVKGLESVPKKVTDLPCEDPFERICVLEALMRASVVQLFLKSEDDRPKSVEIAL